MMRKTSAMACGITTVLLLLLCIVLNTAAQPSAESQPIPASPPGTVIPVAEVATQATEVPKLLRTLRAKGVPSPAIDTSDRVLPEASGTIDLELAVTSTMLQGQPTLELLQTQQQLWQRRQQQMTGWLNVVTAQGQ